MRVSTENALSLALFCVAERALSYLRRKAQPSCVETVKVAGKPFVFGIDLLQPQENELAEVCDFEIPDGKAVKLVAMNGQVPPARIMPFIFLVNLHADQVRHDFRQAVVVVAFDPDHFNVIFRIGELADVAEKLPVLFGKPAEIQVGKDVAKENEPPKADSLQKLQSVRRPAYL